MLRCCNISKSFGTLQVLQAVSFTLQPGEVVGLTGQRGAGKSVLVRILAGLEQPESGQVYVGDHAIANSRMAHKYGLATIHQEPVLVEHLDALSMIFLGHESSRRWGFLRLSRQQAHLQQALHILHSLGMADPPLGQQVGNLSGEDRQLIAIAHVIAQQPQVVVIDDPTALLRLEYQQALLHAIRRWRTQGTTVLFSSQNLDHLFTVTDRILVLREGRIVANERTSTTSRETIVRAQIAAADEQQHTPLIWALDNFYQARSQAQVLHQQHHSLEYDLAAQNALNLQLIAQLAEQITNLDRANTALQAAQRRLLGEREHERKALARDLHDQVIQDLVSLNYDIDHLETVAHVAVAVTTQLADLRGYIRDLIDTVRDICGALRPPTIDSLGLHAALQSFVEDWSMRSDIQVVLTIDPALERLADSIEISLFRMIQEALGNVRKHAQASLVSITLEYTPQRTLRLRISDDGCGLSGDLDLATLAAHGHYGLLGISERVALIRGRFRIVNQALGGTLLEIELPIIVD